MKITELEKDLKAIHDKDKNISFHKRNITLLHEEVRKLLKKNIILSFSGNCEKIAIELKSAIDIKTYPNLFRDVLLLLNVFQSISEVHNFRLILETINTNMCRRFHADMNELRLLCTYSGPGTLWLSDDNVNREALNSGNSNESIVLNADNIHQAEIGEVLILKGSRYPLKGTNPIVHRSPSIEDRQEKRLLLRIDLNESLKF
ncbi:MAG: DUF1826 domain-containing protein [Bacteroidota bacterium]